VGLALSGIPAGAIGMFAVAQTRRQRGTAHKATQRTVHLCHGAESKTLTALRRFRQPLLCSAGAAAVAVLAVRRALCREGAARPEGARVRAKDVVEVNGEGKDRQHRHGDVPLSSC